MMSENKKKKKIKCHVNYDENSKYEFDDVYLRSFHFYMNYRARLSKIEFTTFRVSISFTLVSFTLMLKF